MICEKFIAVKLLTISKSRATMCPKFTGLARKNYITPGSPEIFSIALNFSKIRQSFLIIWVFSQFSSKICVESVQISSEVTFYDVKYQNLRPIFSEVRKNIFGKVVTLQRQKLIAVYSKWVGMGWVGWPAWGRVRWGGVRAVFLVSYFAHS